jgi:peptidoglycan/LPS O-acetylase OafA/YrhL
MRGRYAIRKDLGRFLAKRIIRLDPPYIITICILLVIACFITLAPGPNGESPELSALQVLSHLGYLNAFLGYEWLSPVFWTLAIEFQYYILAALAFPLFASRDPLTRLFSLVLLTLSGVIMDQGEFVFRYGGLFSLGILTFQKHLGYWSTQRYITILIFIAIFTILTMGLLNGFVGVATALLIAFCKVQRYTWLVFIGAISYSLYLMHWPVGILITRLGTPFADTVPLQIAVLATALSASFVAAYIMFRFVERPVQRWSSSIKYTNQVIASGIDPSPTPPLKGEGLNLAPPSLLGKGVGGLGSSAEYPRGNA